MPFLLNSDSELRSGWKLLAFIAVLLPVWVATGFALTLISAVAFGMPEPGSLHTVALNVFISIFPALMATLFAARIVEHLPLSAFGIGFHYGWTSNVATGIGIAAALLVAEIFGSFLLGQFRIEWTVRQSVPGKFLLTLGMLIVAAAVEELLFRGYPLQVLMRGIGTWPAMILMSGIFGLVHAQNPQSSALGVFNTIVAGMMLSLAYLKTRSLWLPYGIHLGWNVGLGMVAGLPLSGMNVASLWTTHVSGARWLLGGEYGPEGGVLGTLIFLAGAIVVGKTHIRQINYDDRFYKDARTG
jgi:membrane protease YdiL (CAAX protease family)